MQITICRKSFWLIFIFHENNFIFTYSSKPAFYVTQLYSPLKSFEDSYKDAYAYLPCQQPLQKLKVSILVETWFCSNQEKMLSNECVYHLYRRENKRHVTLSRFSLQIWLLSPLIPSYERQINDPSLYLLLSVIVSHHLLTTNTARSIQYKPKQATSKYTSLEMR